MVLRQNDVTQMASILADKIDGEWSLWTSWSDCSKQCGTGEKTRTRLCDLPPPANGGADCAGSSTETAACNTQTCPTGVHYMNNKTLHRLWIFSQVICVLSLWLEFQPLGCWEDEEGPDLLKSLEEAGSKPAVLDGDYSSRTDVVNVSSTLVYDWELSVSHH